MAFVKRKRSDSTSSPSSTSSMFSRSSVSPSPPTHMFDKAMQLDVPTQAFPSPNHSWAWQPRGEASNDSGRTMKRSRDNRPDERLIHESTLRRLYNAQREQPNASPMPSEEPIAEEAGLPKQPVQKTTLHRFWNITQPPSQSRTLSLPSVSNNAASARCKGCNVSLSSGDNMDMDMDMDMDGSGSQQQHACNHRGRMVFTACSVSDDVTMT